MDENGINYDAFNYNVIKIMNFCNSIEKTEVQINYLKWIFTKLDPDTMIHPKVLKRSFSEYVKNINIVNSSNHSEFRDYIKQEIKYREEKLNLLSKITDLQTVSKTRVDNEVRIRWMGTESQIIKLIKSLIDENFLQMNKNRFKDFIVKNFINNKGNPYKHKQLSEVEIKYIDKEDPTINLIVDKTKHQN